MKNQFLKKWLNFTLMAAITISAFNFCGFVTVSAQAPSTIDIACTGNPIADSRVITDGTWAHSTSTNMGDMGIPSILYTSTYICNSTSGTPSIKFRPLEGELVAGAKYWVWFFSPKSGSTNEDTAAKLRIAHEEDGNYQADVTIDQRNNVRSAQGCWFRISARPITFKGDGKDYLSITRESTSSGAYTRVGIAKFIPVTDELVVENTLVTPAVPDPYFELSGTWENNGNPKLGASNDEENNWKQYTLRSKTVGSTAKFKALGIKPGKYNVYFQNVKTQTASTNDTSVEFEISHNGKTVSIDGFNQNSYATAEWVQLGDGALNFTGDGTEYVLIRRTTVSDTALTRVGAVKFVPVPSTDIIQLMAEKPGESGVYQAVDAIEADGKYKYSLSLPNYANATDRPIVAIVARYDNVEVDGIPVRLMTDVWAAFPTILAADPEGELFTAEFDVTDYQTSEYKLIIWENIVNITPLLSYAN